ncbi:tyrosine-type recombinase/integrase [Cryobacterium sp. PH29-G1]|uniref:tyrosine-type recombinase/integrase n=1 Tax=Cryobacterium sp. PH29-G1 TaxID=3046211 RepID=UPI0024B98F51|nr:tyrosine-type recombinase/integrase [Cryobacterium sp. PH29-G1]MDJ0350553.1 tyrosine-type recombinase/integrase [Cryobacterium sp. PH29-G1]
MTTTFLPPVVTLRDGYLENLSILGLGPRAMRDRVRIVDAFLGNHPDLAEWMNAPALSRCEELVRTGAWPVIVYAVAHSGLLLDLELIGAKNLTGLGSAIEVRDPDGFTRIRAAGNRLGWTSKWVETLLGEGLAVLLAWTGGTTAQLTADIIDAFESGLSATKTLTPSMLRAYRARVAGLRAILFDTRVIDTPPRRRSTASSYEERFAAVEMVPALRKTFLRYVTVRSAVARPSTVDCLINDLLPFAEYLTAHAPEIRHLRHLRRHHIEAYLIWNRHRSWRGRHASAGAGRTVSTAVAQAAVLTLRNMLEDITDWGWKDVPTRRLVFRADIPKIGQPLPRALAPNIDAALMAAVDGIDDPFARVAVTVLRHTGLRIGELLDLELGSVYDYGLTGSWLKVPLGKLATERMVPLDATALAALDQWTRQRGPSRALPHPRTGTITDFLFTNHGRRLGPTRIRNGLIAASTAAGLRGADGTALIVTPHQLRHTWATELANAGMSLQALMALLGHATAQMTVRYATLASPTLRVAYDDAVGKMRRQLTLTPVGRPIVPDKVAWLNSEMIKTRVAHGYCSRHESAGACSYANICENCANFTTGPEFTDALAEQLDDIQALTADAKQRGWDGEAARHATTAAALTSHLRQVRR